MPGNLDYLLQIKCHRPNVFCFSNSSQRGRLPFCFRSLNLQAALIELDKAGRSAATCGGRMRSTFLALKFINLFVTCPSLPQSCFTFSAGWSQNGSFFEWWAVGCPCWRQFSYGNPAKTTERFALIKTALSVDAPPQRTDSAAFPSSNEDSRSGLVHCVI